MWVWFRADASHDIGSGHVMRCLALADALRDQGVESLFCCQPVPGHLQELIQLRGYAVQLMAITADESADAEAFVSALASPSRAAQLPSWVVVDHYGLGSTWERRVRVAGIPLLAIDDLLRRHDAELLLDQTLGRNSEDYAGRGIGIALTGTDYALLRSAFNRYRERLPHVERAPDAHRLLLTMGGVDLPNITTAVLTQLLRTTPAWLTAVDIVLSPNAPHYSSVRAMLADADARFQLHGFVDDMASLMQKATIAIGAPGSTTWERACLGLPSVLIPIADNQQMVAESMAAAGAALLCSTDRLASELLPQLQRLQQDWLNMHQRNLALVDGLGARRLAARMFPPLARDGQPVLLQRAGAEHIETVFRWQCAPQTRKFARNPTPPSWPEHQAWMQRKLDAADCYFYIIVHGEQPAGVLRLDRRALDTATPAYEISVFIDPEKTRLGLARNGLRVLMQLHRDVELQAIVLAGNQASHDLFTGLGFERVAATEYRHQADPLPN